MLDEDLWQSICQKVDILMERKVESDTKITFSSMFSMVKHICSEHTNVSLKRIIQSSEYGGQVAFLSNKIRVDSNLIKPLFDRGIGKAIHNIGQVLIYTCFYSFLYMSYMLLIIKIIVSVKCKCL
jgi:hypothetical protein